MVHYNNGNIGSLTHDSSVQNTSETTNHIYLHPKSAPLEYEEWMRKVGSLLQVGMEYTSIKPVLDLLVAAIEPERVFIVSNPPIEEHQIAACIEIILIVDDDKIFRCSLNSFIQLACLKMHHATISVHSSREMERGLREGHIYYSTHCKEDFLVFSGSPYRLNQTAQDKLDEIYRDVEESFNEGMQKAEEFWKLACELENNAQHNHAALMLHQGVEQVYRSILWAVGRESPSTHRLKKLRRRAAVFVPQITQAGLNKYDLEHLDMAYTSLVYHCFDIREVCDVLSLCTDVRQLIQIAGGAIQIKINRLSGNVRIPRADSGTAEVE